MPLHSGEFASATRELVKLQAWFEPPSRAGGTLAAGEAPLVVAGTVADACFFWTAGTRRRPRTSVADAGVVSGGSQGRQWLANAPLLDRRGGSRSGRQGCWGCTCSAPPSGRSPLQTMRETPTVFLKPETRNPKPETRNPKPETRNTKHEARNPKHETRNTKP